METDYANVLEYVNGHPYRSIADIAEALGLDIGLAEAIVHSLHNEWKVYVIYDHFDPMYGYTRYDSPLVEPEIDSK